MPSFREYCEKLSTEQLRALLREEYNGRGSLHIFTILDICEILSQRLPDVPTVDQLIHQICGQYLGKE